MGHNLPPPPSPACLGLQQIKSKGNEKPFVIAGIRYIPGSI